MIIDKKEFTKKLNEVKSVLPDRAVTPAFESVLVTKGYLIASNGEITIKAKMEGIESEEFLLSKKAIELINSLPDGDMEITSDSNCNITIKSGSIKNTFKSADPKQYSRTNISADNEDTALDVEILKKSMSRVLPAVAVGDSHQQMTGMCIECSGGILNLMGLDGHIILWDQLEHEGEFKLLIPRQCIMKLLKMNLSGEVSISHTDTHAVFTTDDYIIETRLITGDFYKVSKMFPQDSPINAKVSKGDLVDAISRAALCSDDAIKSPVIFRLDGDILNVSLMGSNSQYTEDMAMDKPVESNMEIAFNPKLIITVLKTFKDDSVSVKITTGKMPALISEDSSKLRGLVLPVAIPRLKCTKVFMHSFGLRKYITEIFCSGGVVLPPEKGVDKVGSKRNY